MSHLLEPAASGRARCRACGQLIARGELRFGERMPNPFADGEMTVWFHPVCAAYRRPEPLLETLAEAGAGVPDGEALERTARASAAHRRLARIDGAERAPSGKSRCRSCRQLIERGAWRIRIVYPSDGRFSPGGFVHVACSETYFEGHDPEGSLLHFTRDLADDERADLARELKADASRREREG